MDENVTLIRQGPKYDWSKYPSKAGGEDFSSFNHGVVGEPWRSLCGCIF